MLEMTTPLEETVSYKEIFSIGKEEGKEEGKLELLESLLSQGLLSPEVAKSQIAELKKELEAIQVAQLKKELEALKATSSK